MLRSTELIGRVVGGRYRLLRPIGSGASAHVYVAEDVRLRRRVAIKVLHPALAEDRAFQRRFQAEAQTVAALRHRSILRVYDWGDDDGEAYLVMELLEGGSLRAFLDTGARLSVSQAAAVGLDVASALAHAHSRGLVHRDIKPANLLLDDEGHVSVADFGIARALAEASWTEPLGAMMGTARYAAPEQLRAVALDGRADVYALAMVLVEAVTGTVPFAMDTTLGALIARADRPLPVPAELGPLSSVLERAGTAASEERLTAEEMAQSIAQVATALRAPAPLAVPGLARPAPAEHPEDRTEMGSGRRPRGDDLSILAQDLPRVEDGPTVDDNPVVLQEVDGALAPSPPATELRASEPGAPGAPSEPTSPGRAAPEAPVSLAGPTGPSAPASSVDRAPATAPAPGTARRRGAPAPVGATGTSAAATAAGPTIGAATAPSPAPERPPHRRRRRWLIAVVVVVLLAILGGGGAAAAYILTRPAPTYAVPVVSGDTVAMATAALDRQHLQVAVGARAWSSAAVGSVITQRPGPGVRLHARQTVVVTLSKGPEPVAVPGLATLDLAQARAELKLFGLVLGPATPRSSLTVPAHIIISWQPKGGRVLPGTKVKVVVSTGKPKEEVPAIGPSTASYPEMKAALAHLGFVVTEGTTWSDTVPDGEVISTYPAPGSVELYGTRVLVTVSIGPHLVTIPQGIVGLSAYQAQALLARIGLGVNAVHGNPGAQVTGSLPAVGTAVHIGLSVVLVTN